MSRRSTILLSAIVALLLVVSVAWQRLNFYLLTGHVFPIEKIEALQNSIGVTGWSPAGLNLADGRMLPIPGLRSLPDSSAALAEVTKRGVEVSPNGRIWGLVGVHHWCGNDPVRAHVARVDLSDMMTFLSVGEPVAPVPESESWVIGPGGTFTEWGWRVGEFLQFELWEKIKDPAR